MKKYIIIPIAALCGIVALCGCAKEVVDEYEIEPDSSLTVKTRSLNVSSNDDSEVSTPIRVYVFSGDNCVAMKDIDTADESLTINLNEGIYSVYAIGGADPDRLTLPSKESAQKKSVIGLQSGKSLDDLMMAQGTVTLTKGGTNTLILGMMRKVCLLKNVKIKGVADDILQVKVGIAPVYKEVLLDGTLQDETSSTEVSLTKSTVEEGTWLLTQSNVHYLFPSIGNPTISVALDDHTYSYTADQTFPANHHINIEGTYTSSSVELSGTIEGVVWENDLNINFNFNEDGSSKVDDEGNTSGDTGGDEDTGDTGETEDIPEVGTLYKGCYVLAVDGKNVTLFSPTQIKVFSDGVPSIEAEKREIINQALSTGYENTGIWTWRLPNRSEAETIVANQSTIKSKTQSLDNSSGYLFDNEDTIMSFRGSSNNFTEGVTIKINYLRPVTTITFE